jgi:HEAT repeat protein
MIRVAQKTCLVVVAVTIVCILFGMSALTYADAKSTDLIRLLNSENRGWRYSAARLLGERKVDEAVEPLMKQLKVEKDPSVRIVIAQALHKIGDPRAIEALREAAKTDRNRTVRHLAAVLASDLEKFAYSH